MGDGLQLAICPSFTGATGLTALDVSGRSNHGVLTNMDRNASWVTSGGMGAMSFDGINQWVTKNPINFPPRPNASFTASLWISWLATQADFRLPFGFGADVIGGNRGYFIWRSSTGFVRSEFGSSTGVALSSIATANNVWTHCVGRYDSSTNKLFLNGSESASTNYSSANLDSGSVLGLGGINGTNNVPSYFTNCAIDDVRIYDRVLNSSEIRQMYERGRGGGMLYKPPRSRVYFGSTSNRRRRILCGGNC